MRETTMKHPIQCPQCGSSFELTAALQGELEDELRTRLGGEFEARATAMHAAHQREVQRLEAQSAEAARRAREVAALEVEARVRGEAEAERARLLAEHEARAKLQAASADKLLEEEREAARQQLDQAAAQRQALLGAQRELEERVRLADVTAAERLAQETRTLREELGREHDARVARELETQATLLRQEAQRADAQRASELAGARHALEQATAREQSLQAERRSLEEKMREFDEELAARTAAAAAQARQQATLEAEARVRAQAAAESAQLSDELGALRSQLTAAQDAEVELRRQRRELEERARALALDVERKVDDAMQAARAQQDAARAQLEQKLEAERQQAQLQLREAQLQREGLSAQVRELQHKLAQGSQQLQGEAQEVLLQDLLVKAFPADGITEVAKGVPGADIIQQVCAGGRVLGTIVWESKRTKAWQKDWLGKLRDQQREASADCAILVSQVLPEGLRGFGDIDGVWVTGWEHAIAVAGVMRQAIIEIGLQRQAGQARDGKAQRVYDYLTGSEFRNRIAGVIEPLLQMQASLCKERLLAQRGWAQREKEIKRALDNLTAVSGALSGIAGQDLAEVEGLEPPEAALALSAGPAALGDGARGDDDDAWSDADERAKEALFDLTPEDGSAVGNQTLRDRLARTLHAEGVSFTEEDFRRYRARLVEEGRARKGAGRGGSLARVARASVQAGHLHA